MKQVIQSYRTGRLRLCEVALPALQKGQVLVKTAFSAVSLGTEGQKVMTARSSLLKKASSRPDLVRQVLQTARREGFRSTYRKVIDQLGKEIPLGYSASGRVIKLGARVEEFQVGDRVACGGEMAAHAEVLAVPMNLCVEVPDEVRLDLAAFTTIGAIGLQAIRQADVRLGECVAVLGLGLVGQVALQLLQATGCRAFGIDLEAEKVAMAKKLGAAAVARQDPNLHGEALALTRGRGFDAVLVTAATSSTDPVELAADLCRDRGRIVVVGNVKMNFPRDIIYAKELDIRLSRSYGPGRYDPVYEEKGVDYPIGYVRWTERRNMEAFLDLLAGENLRLEELITHRFLFDAAEQAYSLVTDQTSTGPRAIGVLFEYPAEQERQQHFVKVKRKENSRTAGHRLEVEAAAAKHSLGVGFIGAGRFARKFLIPPLVHHSSIRLVGVATATAPSGRRSVDQFGFEYSTGDHHRILDDSEITAVFIATPHRLHAELAMAAVEAGKTVFVEKPLAIDFEQLQLIIGKLEKQRSQSEMLMVGFNRRFSSLVHEMKSFFAGCSEPMVVHYRVNAGFVETGHWVHDLEIGGGRVIGEVCHFVDLVTHLVPGPIQSVYASAMRNVGKYHNDNVSISLRFGDGSVGNILYLANGNSQVPKERIEVFCQGATAVLDDFRQLLLYRDRKRRRKKIAQDKGHSTQISSFVEAVAHNKDVPIPLEESVLSTLVTLRVLESLQQNRPLTV